MALDEAATVRSLEAARGGFRDHIARHGGRVVDTAGDSVLAVFDSATNAAEAAIAIQQHFADQVAETSSDVHLRFRIGLHLGDVLERDDGTVYGNGINVAARTQTLAEPGKIAASSSVRSATHGKLRATYIDLGEHEAKNIAEPIHVFELRPVAESGAIQEPGRSSPARAPNVLWRQPTAAAVSLGIGALTLLVFYVKDRAPVASVAAPAASSVLSIERPGAKPFASDSAGPLSIVVMPFVNLTGNDTQAYIADGLTASVTADLARIRDAFVVSAASALAYRDKALTTQQVGRDLGVRFVLRGNVQRDRSVLRISAQLSDATTDELLWSETFEGESSDLFRLQDKVTTRISGSMGRELVVRAARESERKGGDANAGTMLLQARALELRTQSLNNWQAIETIYRRVLALQPDSVPAMGGLAESLALQGTNFFDEIGPTVTATKFDEAAKFAAQIRELDPENPRAYRVLGLLAFQRGDFDQALQFAQMRLALEPKSQSAYNSVAYVRYWRAEPREALALLEGGLALDPKHPYDASLVNMAKVQLMLGNANAAIEWSLKARAANPSLVLGDPTLPVAFVLIGDRERARAEAAMAAKAAPGFTIAHTIEQTSSKPPALRKYYQTVIVPAMRAAGFPD